MRTLAAALQLSDELNSGSDLPSLRDCSTGFHTVPNREVLIDTIAARLNHCGQECVERELKSRRKSTLQPVLASVAVRFDKKWRPRPAIRPFLAYAMLRNVSWDRIDLRRYEMPGANFQNASLKSAIFIGATAAGADFRGAVLDSACLRDIHAALASFSGVDLTIADCRHATMHTTDLSGVSAAGCNFENASLVGANMRRGDFTEANFSHADLRTARVNDAMFASANFSRACLAHVNLQSANLQGATFFGTNLECACLADVSQTGLKFDNANLKGADLTGADFRAGSFTNVSFVGAYLAEVDLSGADLRNANFTDATFHMGSSRNGLVGSEIASEGSRTGFYTTDHDEQYFKCAEEIRVANLRGCDLRDACIFHTDFWRVDLRDAVYDGDQQRHLRATGAILS